MKNITKSPFLLLSLLALSITASGQEYQRTLVHTSESPYATYERYAYTYNQITVEHAQQLVIRGNNGYVETVANQSLPAVLPNHANQTNLGMPIYFFHNDQWISGYKVVTDQPPVHSATYLDANGSVLYTIDLNMHFQDTSTHVQVFQPDPLTRHNLTYGGVYKDVNDQNTTVLDSLTYIDTLHLNHSGDTVFLVNSSATMLDFDAPYLGVPTFLTDSLIYSRSQSEFEQIMAMYYITGMKNRLNELGYTSLMNYSISVDAHALNGSDNSMFSYGGNTPKLYFGEGGVDDAEDADVIIHEYGHAITHNASPNSTYGQERRTFDEAYGDYWAESFARKRFNVSHNRVFNWDGNNEFWQGRALHNNSNKWYPNLVFPSIYTHTDVMSSAGLEMHATVGQDVTDKLWLEVSYQLLSNQSLEDIAYRFLVADSLQNAGANTNAILDVFHDRGMLLDVSVAKEVVPTSAHLVLRGEEIYVKLPENNLPVTIEVYTLSGQLYGRLTPESTVVRVNDVLVNGVLRVFYTDGTIEVLHY